MKPEEKSLKDKYVKLEQIAAGTYGVVYKGKIKATNQFCAIKKFKNVMHQGIPASAIREINAIKAIKSPYVLPILDIFAKTSSIKMVTPWKDLTLQGLIGSGSAYCVKKIIKQLIQAINSIHKNDVIHRDLKPANIVLDEGENINLKIIDFGMAKQQPFKMLLKGMKMTIQVGTLYYRAPQLLNHDPKYGFKVDIWSLGCIIYELLTKKIMFKGTSQANQLIKIYSAVCSTEQYSQMTKQQSNVSEIQCDNWVQIEDDILKSGYGQNEINLLKQMLAVNPENRLSAEQLIKSQCFLETVKQ